MNCYKIYIYWEDIRRCYCPAREKIIRHICVYQPERNILIGIILEDTISFHRGKNCNIFIYLPETDTFIWDANVSHCATQGILLYTGKFSLSTCNFLLFPNKCNFPA